MGNKIIYNGQEYNGAIVNDAGVGEFVSNSGKKMPTDNNEIFNSYNGSNQINGTASNSTVLGSSNVLGNTVSTISNSVLGGYNNNIQGDIRNSLIYGSGITGTISHINESAIFGDPTFTGTGTQIEQSLIAGSSGGKNLHVHESLMINGGGNIDVESSIISGQNTLGSSSLRVNIHTSIIGGVNNIQPINNNPIMRSLIVGNNSIAGYGIDNSIIGGAYNTISGTSWGCDESLIVGMDNEFSDIESSIMGGKRNKINNISGGLVLGADNKTLGTYIHEYAVFLGRAGICGPSATNFHIEGQGDSSTHTKDKINAFLGETSEHTWSYYLDHSHQYSMQEPPISNMCGDISGHVEGEKTAIYRGIGAHSEGNRTMTIGTGSHSEGYGTAIIGEGAHIEGTYNEAASFVTGNVGTYEISGNATSERLNNNKWGTDNYYTYSSVSNGGNAGAHIEGQNNFTLSSNSAHVENENNLIIQMPSSHTEGQSNIGYQGSVNHIEGYNNLSLMIPGGQSSVDINTAKTHIEGLYNKAVGQNGTHMEGHYQIAYRGDFNHLEGGRGLIFGDGNLISNYNHIEGCGNNSISDFSEYTIIGAPDLIANTSVSYLNSSVDVINTYPFANTITGAYNHLEGYMTSIQNSNYCHAEGSSIIDTTNKKLYHQSINGNSHSSHIEGGGNFITGSSSYSHAEGSLNTIHYSSNIHVEGVENQCDGAGNRSHIEGYLNMCLAGSNDVHMEGGENITKEGGNFRHIEGYKNIAHSGCSIVHVEGTRNDVGSLGSVGHIEGEYNHIDSGSGNTHIEGYNNIATNNTVCSHIEGVNNIGTNSTNNCHIEGMDNYTLNNAWYSHVEGMNNSIASSTNNHIEGNSCFIVGSTDSHIEGIGDSTDTNSDYIYQHSYLGNTTEDGNRQAITYSTSYSSRSIESKMYSHYIYGSTNCHIEGKNNITTSNTGSSSGLSGIGPALDGQPHSNHLEGCYNLVLGSGCHVEGGANLIGYKTTDNSGETPKYQSYWSMYSHAEGHRNKISGTFATHVEGILNDIQEWVDPTFDPEDPESTGYADEMLHSYAAHAEGSHNIVRGYAAHAQGLGTIANAQAQATMGRFNVEDVSGTNNNPKGTYAVIIGNGTSTEMEIYDNTETYAVDDEVVYEGVAYKCIVAVTEAEDFDSEKWDELDYEIIDDAKVTRSNAATLTWDGYLDVSGGFSVNGTPISTGGSGDIANPNISDAYSNSATYNVGEYCIYQDTLYKCNTAITVAEAWTASHWTATTVGAELLTIISRVSALENQLNGFTIHSAMTQAQYDVLTVKDPNTLYPIVG